MRVVRVQLENLVLNKLSEIQEEIYKHPKTDKRTVTAADLFKPTKRRMVGYGLAVNEVSLTRVDWKVFQRTPAGEAEYRVSAGEWRRPERRGRTRPSVVGGQSAFAREGGLRAETTR